ncbi:Protein of unknown function [Bacillus mycoides]|nr:Protein of unknown function [Bacillus mycoides]
MTNSKVNYTKDSYRY